MAASRDDTQFEGTREGSQPTSVALDASQPVTIHTIPQAHIDLAWKWTAADGVEMVLETFRGHVELLEADSDRTYAQSQLAAYEIVEREDPALFERVRRLIDRGQWEVVGGEWVEPDRALPGGEALLRQLLEGQRYAEEKLGVRATVAWSPDSFTWHPPNLPQLLSGAGIRFQAIKRPREKYASLPLTPFLWRGIDGTDIITLRSNNKGSGLPTLSEGSPEPLDDSSHLHVYAEAYRNAGLDQLWGPRGVGDTGGVNDYPAPESGPGWSSIYSTPGRYAEAISAWARDADVQVVEGAIGPVMTGCLTTHSEMKSLNRGAENMLQSAETVASLAQCLDLSVPDTGDGLRKAWRRVLFNQFHDVVTGVGIPQVHVDAAHDYEEAIRVATDARRVSVRAIARHAGGEGGPDEPRVVVVNDLGWTRTGVVELDAHIGDDDDPGLWEAVAPDGSVSPVCIHGITRAQSWTRHRCSFLARETPGLGYATHRLRQVSRADKLVRVRGTEVMTDDLTVRFDAAAGAISSLMNRTDAVHFNSGLARPRLWEEGEYFLDYGVEHRAWYLGLTGAERPVGFAGMRIAEQSAGIAAVETAHRFGSSELRQRFIVRPDVPYVEVQAEIDWHEIEHLLRLHFPFESNADTIASFDSSYGVVDRVPDGTEMPMQMFCALSDGQRGLGILNDGRYGAQAGPDGLAISAVRCSTLPDPRSDEGVARFRYALVPHEGTWREASLPKLAYEFNRPLIGIATDDAGHGAASAEWSLASSGSASVLPTVLKTTAVAGEWALRVYNAAEAAGPASMRFGPGVTRVRDANLLEEDAGRDVSPASEEFGPFAVATWLVSRDA